jgi:hypothetical protein
LKGCQLPGKAGFGGKVIHRGKLCISVAKMTSPLRRSDRSASPRSPDIHQKASVAYYLAPDRAALFIEGAQLPGKALPVVNQSPSLVVGIRA